MCVRGEWIEALPSQEKGFIGRIGVCKEKGGWEVKRWRARPFHKFESRRVGAKEEAHTTAPERTWGQDALPVMATSPWRHHK